MFVSKRAFQAAQNQILQLRRDLVAAQGALSDHAARERDVADAMIAARANARDVRLAVEQDAQDLLARATKDAEAVKTAAEAEAATTRMEVARLQRMQRDLTASFEQKVAALRSALAQVPMAPAVETSLAEWVPPRAVQSPAPGVPPVQRAAGPASEALAALFRDVRAEASSITAETSPQQLRPSRNDNRPVPRAFDRFRHRGTVVAAGTLLVTTAALAWWALAGGASVSRAATRGALPATEAAGPSSSSAEAMTAPAAKNVATPRNAAHAVTVHLQAVRNVWLRVEVDGKNTMSRLVEAGEQLGVAADRAVVLRAGDAGALLVSVNGEHPTLLGRNGAVVTKRITAPVAMLGPAAAATESTLPSRQPGQTALERRTARRGELPAGAEPVSPAALVTPAPATPSPQPELPPGPAATPSETSAREPVEMRPPANEDEQTVVRGHEQYFHALGRGDERDIARLAANAFTTTGAPKLDPAGQPYPISVSSTQVEVRGVGAVVSGTASQRISGPGVDGRDEPLLFSEIWVKRGSQWQLMNVRFMSPGVRR